jgi:hypothetical protein
MLRIAKSILALGPITLAAIGLACASTSPNPTHYDFFAKAAPGNGKDPWYGKVEVWQKRAQEEGPLWVEAVEDPGFRSGALREEIGAFKSDRRRELARAINSWAQVRARKYYRFDVDSKPANDHWPTIQELLERNGDDCDGLDLIAYQLLREFGFQSDEVYRVIVKRDRDGVNHMVTLWFESKDDPWILDATGAFTLKMRKFSETSGWTPTKMFNEAHQYQVVERKAGAYALGN